MPWKPRILALSWDIGVILLTGALAYLLRFIQAPPEAQVPAATIYLIASGLVGCLLWWLFGFSRRSLRHATQADAQLLGLIAICTPIAGLIASFLFDRGEALPRSIIILHFLLLVGGLVGARAFAKSVILGPPRASNADEEAGPVQNVILIGDGPGISAYIKALMAVGISRTKVAAAYVFDQYLDGTTIRGQRVSLVKPALWAEIATLTGDKGPDCIVIAANPATLSKELRDFLAVTDLRVSFFGWSRDQSMLEGVGAPDVNDRRKLSSIARTYLPWKRLADIMFASVGLILAAVPLAIAAFLVRIFLGAPVTFWQWRPGRYGQSIKVLKLRSMRHAIDGQGRRLSDAERVGWFGTALRRSRLDELPQLFSILIGDMSLVGPRPLIHQQQKPDSIRLLVRPGLTGWAQVNGGQLLSEGDKETLDCWYVENLTLMLDVKIIIMTFWVVLFGDKVPEGMAAKADPLAGDELYGKAHVGNLGTREQ